MTAQLTPTLIRMWYPRGSQPEPAMWTGTRQKTHIFGALNAKNGRFHSMQAAWINSESFIKFLKRIGKTYRGKNIIIILDNAKWHKSKKVWKHLLGHKTYLEFLPPYCPNLNPTEKVWKWFRRDVTHNYFHETLSKLVKSSAVFCRGLRKHKNRLISFCLIS